MAKLYPDIRAIFSEALELESADEVIRYLDDICRDDANLRLEILALLNSHHEAGNFLGGISPDDRAFDHSPLIEQLGTLIGPYKLLEQIGEGGFGVVFLAEQERPVRRKVALKIIKPGMDTRQVIARFEAERQALAMMDHPNIAKVLDAGMVGAASRVAQDTTPQDGSESPARLGGPTGRPYFVMELVAGVPITEYCDQCNLTTRERLELFITVCQAVQHAHQKGIIHRDIKPTNVLVTIQNERPAPKIIDFGVAKAIGQRLTDHTLTTGFAQMVGSPLYMSPEQADLSPLGVDTRSDIYSLGVLLYELLTGTTPFDKDRLQAASYDELRHIIRKEEPPRPSTRLSSISLLERAEVSASRSGEPSQTSSDSLPLAGRTGEGVSAAETANLATTIAERRRTEPRRLIQTVRGELDWIVMKALDKDRSRRYETASSLARDIERYLHDEPVQACPPSASYRFRKFARRNKTLLAAGGAVAAALLTGLGLSTWMYFRERAAVDVAMANEVQAKANEAQAMTESARARAVSDLFLEIIFSPSYGWRIKGSQYTVREVLDDFAAGLENQLADQPEVEADLRHAIGSSYLMLGVPELAEPHFQRAIEIRTASDNRPKKSLADSLANYGAILYLQRRYDEAESPLSEALKIYHGKGVRGTMPIFVCRVLQSAMAAAGRHDDAEKWIQQGWGEMQGYDKLPRQFAQSPCHDVSATCASFAYYFATIGRNEEAVEFLRRASLAQQHLQKPLDSFGALQFLASARLRLGDGVGYRAACRGLAERPARITNKEFDQADEYELGRIITCCLGPDAVDDPNALVKQADEFAANNELQATYVDLALLGTVHYRAGQYQQAAQYLEQSISQYPSDPPPSHGTVLWPQMYLAMTKWQLGTHDDARRLLREIQPELDSFIETPMLMWQRRANVEIVRYEAEALIVPKNADEAPENVSHSNDK